MTVCHTNWFLHPYKSPHEFLHGGGGQYQIRHELSLLPADTNRNRWLQRGTHSCALHLKCVIKQFWQLSRRTSTGLLFISCGICVCPCSMYCTCNDGVTLIVEGTREDLIRVALQNLKADSRLNIPHTSCLVGAGSQDPPALRAETDLPKDPGD